MKLCHVCTTNTDVAQIEKNPTTDANSEQMSQVTCYLMGKKHIQVKHQRQR